jgi:hypothetical protein
MIPGKTGPDPGITAEKQAAPASRPVPPIANAPRQK